VFSALDPAGSGLTVAAPEAFGFLGPRPAAIAVDGGGILEVPGGEALSLVGGDVAVTAGRVAAPAGRLTLSAFAGPGTANVASGEAAGDASGGIRLAGGAVVASSGGGGGVAIRAGRLTLEQGSAVLADNTGALDARGAITVVAGEITLDPRSRIAANARAEGGGGTVVVEVGRLLVAGVTGQPVFTGIGSEAAPDSSGEAGAVVVRAGEIELRPGAQISSGTLGRGDAGTVTVEVGRLLVVGDPEPGAFTGVASNAVAGSSGNAGTVTVRAGEVELRSAGQVTSVTTGPGDAGTVTVEAGRLLIVGVDRARTPTGVFSDASPGSSGDAGTVTVSADDLEIRARGSIGSSGLGTGAASDVGIEAGTLRLVDASLRTVGRGAEGGRIVVAAGDLIHLVGAEVTSNGIAPEAGASLIALRADTIVLNRSTVTSLTGAGQPLAGSGEASLLGDVTVISTDSLVAASSSVVTTGVQTNIGTGLQLQAGAFVDAGRLLREGCAERGAAAAPRSSFTRAGRGGLPPSPDRPLASAPGTPDAEAPPRGAALAAAPASAGVCD
jgi:large exoprotein involved in heme utilization and adhesion